MAAEETPNRTMQIANSASLMLVSRAMTAVGVPLMLFFASQLWNDVDFIKKKFHETEITLTQMKGDMQLLKWRIDVRNDEGGSRGSQN